MLPAMVVFLKPRCQRCRDSKILVTMTFWEAHSRHAGELSVFLFSRKMQLSTVTHRVKSSKNHQNVYIKAEI